MAKSYNHLFEKLIDHDNIRLAFHNAAKRKHNRGDVAYIFEDLETHITNVIYILENNEFKSQIHNLMKIQDGVHHKERFIVQPYFYRNQYSMAVYEQVIHHAVIQVLRPIFERSMYFHSNGSIPDRGCHRGKKYLEKFIKKHKNSKDAKYFIKADIRHYYESINVNTLKSKLSERIHDNRFLRVVYTILDSNIAVWDKEKHNMGLPIGFYTSQWFANFYLEKFDHFVKQVLKVKYYSRYMDDFVLIGASKRALHKIFERIKEYLAALSLEIKSTSKVALFDFIKATGERVGECIDFMGFKFFRDRVTLRKHVLHNAKQAANTIQKAINFCKMNWFIACRMISYFGWFKTSDTYGYYSEWVQPKAHLAVCRKVVRQHDHSFEVPYSISNRHKINALHNLFKKQGLDKYRNILRRNTNDKLENIRKLGKTYCRR